MAESGESQGDHSPAVSTSDADDPNTFQTPTPPTIAGWHVDFCKWYALIGNGKLAYERCRGETGGSASSAHRLLRRVDIQAYVAALRAELAGSRALARVSSSNVTSRYNAIANVRHGDRFVRDPERAGGWRCRQWDELTRIEQAAVQRVHFGDEPKRTKAKAKVEDDAPDPETVWKREIIDYTLYAAPDALAALARLGGLNRDTVKHAHDHEHRGRVDGTFAFIAQNERTSETSARLRARHGTGGARIIDVTPQAPAIADQRPLRKLRGV